MITGANPIWPNQSQTQHPPPPHPPPQLGFPLGPAQPAFNSFGLGHGLFAPAMPTTAAATVAQGPAHFGVGHHVQQSGQSLMNSMQQEKPLQLNQLPGFNLFNVSVVQYNFKICFYNTQ